MRRIIVALSLSSAAASAVLACANHADTDSASREDETRIRPDGSDLPGTIVVSAPAGASNVEPMEIFSGNARVKLGEALGPLPVGDQSFEMETKGATTLWFSGNARATIASDRATTVTTALLGVKAVGGPPTFGLGDWSSEAIGIHIRQAGEGTGRGGVKTTADGSRLLPLLAGDYYISFGLADGVVARMVPGTTTIVTLTDPAARRVVRLRAPVRELPDATCATPAEATPWELRLRGEPNTRSIVLKAGEELDVGVALGMPTVHELRASAWGSAVVLPLGEPGAGPKTWQLGRIDVDDVSINGRATVKGRYAVYPADANGVATDQNFLGCTPTTNTGVDVPPGRYRVEIKYWTTEAGEKTDVHVVDVP